MAAFKSAFKEFIGRLGAVGGPGRSPFSSDSYENDHELNVVPREMTTSFQEEFPPPSPPSTPIERMETPDQDEILFRKNNVFLSYPKQHVSNKSYDMSRLHSRQSERTPSPHAQLPSSTSSLTDSSNSNSSNGSFPDNQVLVPGYLFVTTRGSNYGTTLILNWAPNSSMKTPASSASPTPPPPLALQSPTAGTIDDTRTVITAPPSKRLPNGGQSSATAADSAGESATDIGENQLLNGTIITDKTFTRTEHTDGDDVIATSRNREIPSLPLFEATNGRHDGFAAGGMGEERGGRAGTSYRRGSKERSLSYDRPSCSSVSIDLGKMEMIRIFYNTDTKGFIVSGEMVIRSKDRNFKVFRFKTGGLNDLIHILRSWKYFKHNWHKESHQHTFTIFQPKLSLLELHPLEGTIKSLLTVDMWRDLKDEEGRIIDKQYVLKVVFFQGVAPPLRKELWPFLLGLYSFDSSERERTRVKSKKLEEYWKINKIRRELEKEAVLHAAAVKTVKTAGEVTRQTSSTLSPRDNGSLRNSSNETSRSSSPSSNVADKKSVRQQKAGQVGGALPQVDIKAWTKQIERDIIRTDRSHPYYKGDSKILNDLHDKTLLNIILNYLIHKPDVSYCQGMTDLLAPILAALDDEAEAFWCFTNLLQSRMFFTPGKNHISIKHLLEPLSLLIQLLIPSFHSYLESIDEGTTLMFCHRWLLVCLKREFQEDDSLHIWETCWTNYETTSFHLFICVAIMAIYGQRAIDRNMNINELMVFFSSLSLSMPRDIVLSQARGYLHRFCRCSQVSCKLYPIMTNEFWERKGSPKLSCDECNGLVNCPRTGFVVKKGAVC